MKKLRAVILAVAAMLAVFSITSRAEANTAVRPTAPALYVGPYYGWAAWCGLLGWQASTQGRTMVISVVIGSTTDDGSGRCDYTPTVAEADLGAMMTVTDSTGHLVNYAFATMGTDGHYRSGGNFLAFSPGWFTVNVAGRWVANGQTINYSLPPQNIYLY